MPPMKRKRGASAPAFGVDRIGALPDALLQHVLSFLPAQVAVQTSMLARRWRNLWKSSAGLRIHCGDEKEAASVGEFREFVDHLFFLRGHAPLETCEIRFGEVDDEDVPRVNLWLRHAVMCKVRRLRLDNIYYDDLGFELDNLPLVSRQLTRLELIGVVVNTSFCNFSGCPSLGYLELSHCYLADAEKISSESMKHLSITNCSFGEWYSTLIYVPNLVSLRLDKHVNRAPALVSMPSLQEAFVRVTNTYKYDDFCVNAYSGECEDENCYSCSSIDYDSKNNRSLLEGMSEAENLTLIVESKMFMLKRDLKQCPTFTKLKILLLDDYWCASPDFHEITCILNHSPVLEKLILQLFCKGPKHKLRMKGSRNPTKMSAAISKHLQIVEVKCEVIDDRILKVLKFMRTLNICFSLDEVEILEG